MSITYEVNTESIFAYFFFESKGATLSMKWLFAGNRVIPVIALVIILSIYAWAAFPVTNPDINELLLEGGIFAVCIYFLCSIHNFKEQTEVYNLLYISISILIIASSINLLSELFELGSVFEIVEDVLSTGGYILLLFGCVRWSKKHTELLNQVMHLAEVDSLTEISNRRAFLKCVKKHFELSGKNSNRVGILVIDADDFKTVNDIHGHLVGDQVLKCIANTIKLTLRKGDDVARWGGEEFVVFLKETTNEEVMITAERIRSSVEKMDVYHHKTKTKVKGTVSIGFSTSDTNKLEFETLYEQADQAMYKAKSLGKNRSCMYDASLLPRTMEYLSL